MMTLLMVAGLFVAAFSGSAITLLALWRLGNARTAGKQSSPQPISRPYSRTPCVPQVSTSNENRQSKKADCNACKDVGYVWVDRKWLHASGEAIYRGGHDQVGLNEKVVPHVRGTMQMMIANDTHYMRACPDMCKHGRNYLKFMFKKSIEGKLEIS